MAFSTLVLRRLPAAADLAEALLLRSSRPVAVAATRHVPPRSFSNAAQVRDTDDDESRLSQADRYPAASRRGDLFPSFFADVFEPFYPARSLAQMLNMIDQAAEGSLAGSRRGMVGGARRGWDAREDGEGLYLRVDMPGLGKEDVKVTVEEDTLVVKGESAKEDGDDARRYGGRIDLPGKLYDFAKVRAEMRNGVLKVFVPKVKEEERKDVLQVQIE